MTDFPFVDPDPTPPDGITLHETPGHYEVPAFEEYIERPASQEEEGLVWIASRGIWFLVLAVLIAPFLGFFLNGVLALAAIFSIFFTIMGQIAPFGVVIILVTLAVCLSWLYEQAQRRKP